MDAPAETHSTQTSWKDRLEFFSKATLTLIGLSYVVGLLILNLHLRRFGITYLGFVQVEYVMTGILWLFLICSTELILSILWNRFLDANRNLKEHRKWLKGCLGMIGVLILPTLSFAYVIYILSDGELPFFRGRSWFVYLILIVNATSVLGIRRAIEEVFPDFHLGVVNIQDNYSNYQVLYKIVILLTSLSLYSSQVFPYLAAPYGGGRKQVVSFVIKPDRVEGIKAFGYEVQSDTRVTQPIELIFESSDSFICSPDSSNQAGNKAVRIRKEDVEATFYKATRIFEVFPF